VVEESFLVTGLDWVAEEVLAARVAKCDELSVAVDALRADGSDIIVADALSDCPLAQRTPVGVFPIVCGLCGLGDVLVSLGLSSVVAGGFGDWGGGCGGGGADGMAACATI
jgi:hypothetical protein